MNKQLIIDGAGLVGFGLFIYGVSLVSKEAGYIVAGFILMVFAVKAKVSK